MDDMTEQLKQYWEDQESYMKNGEIFRRIDKLEKSVEIKNDDVDLYDVCPIVHQDDLNDRDEMIF